MHRSVAMAERLAGDAESRPWDEVVVVVVVDEHLDTDVGRGIRRVQRARAASHGPWMHGDYHAGDLLAVDTIYSRRETER